MGVSVLSIFSIAEPHWIVVLIIGALLPLTAAVLSRVARGVFVRLFTKGHLILGEWYVANSSRQDAKSFTTRERWNFYRDILGNIRVSLNNEDNPEIRYKGGVKFEGSHAIVMYSAVSHTETVVMRCYLPPTPNARFMSGLWLSHDYDGAISAGVVRLARAPFAEWEHGRMWVENSNFRDSVLTATP